MLLGISNPPHGFESMEGNIHNWNEPLVVNCDVNGKWDSTHLVINIGSHATMGHIVKIVDIR